MTRAETMLGKGTPEWADTLARRYVSGASSVFLLHGNVHDLVPAPNGRFLSLMDYLAEQMFGRRDIVLGYDRGSGIRFLAPAGSSRRSAMQTDFTRTLEAIDTVNGTGFARTRPREPTLVLELFDRYILHKLVASSEPETPGADPERKSLAVVIRYLETITPPLEGSQLSGELGTLLLKILNWANDPAIRGADITLCLVTESLGDVNRRLVENPFIAKIEIPLPNNAQRRNYAETLLTPEPPRAERESNAQLDPARVAEEANGLTLVGLAQAVSQARSDASTAGGSALTALRASKKSLIEKQCLGLVEFVSPRFDLSAAVLPGTVRERFELDARLFRQGRYAALPMGYLLCGGIGTGKTFTATCFAGSLAIPAIVFKNLRSKWVGSSEGNLQKVLSVIQALGPVLVIIDEADAALGTRRASGDSGTGARMFAMVATLMSDTRFRGRILWMLLTARPDLLPVDLKRQGRCEVHIPLFPPTTSAERREMMLAMARKSKLQLSPDDVPEIPAGLTGADIESLLIQAIRIAAIEDMHASSESKVGRTHLEQAIDRFVPPEYGLAKELQRLVAIRECTDRRFVPDALRYHLDSEHATQLERRIEEIRNQLGER